MSTTFDFDALKSAKLLPSPSGIALAIMQMVQKDDTTVQKLAATVKGDPALTARILSFVNSAAFGAHRPIASIYDAVQMMGMHAVRNFALGLSLVGNNRTGKCVSFDYDAYWMKSLAMAVAIAAITARERTLSPEEAFTLGLLSDIGLLALATVWPDVFAECLRSAQGDQLLKLENDRFGVDHKGLTLMLLHDWGLPDIFLDALKLSFGPPQAEVSRTVRFASQLAFARQVANYCVADDRYRHDLLLPLQQEAAPHGIENDEFDQFIDEIVNQWHEWGKLINIKTDVRLPSPQPDQLQATGLVGLHILLVDGDPIILTFLSKQLSAVGHRISVCRDGESALKQVIENKPQLVITDWRMAPMDGLELCKTLRRSEVGKTLYIIMLTSAGTESEVVEAFDAGIDDYVTKPVSLKILLARIRAGQRIAELQQELEKEKQDIERYNAELAIANRRLRDIANTDILTNLPNRRYALVRLEQEWEAAQRYQRPLSVLMLDLDHFKLINDSLGHDAGDDVLVHTAKIIKAATRTSDVTCRLGGEEFLVIATNTDGHSALMLAERIRIAIQTFQPKGFTLTRPLTISIGVAASSDRKPDWKGLMKMADSALYKVKASSRNAALLASC
jgi:two-component system cell cycle response regulator